MEAKYTDTVLGLEAKYASWPVYCYCIDIIVVWRQRYVSWPVYSYCTDHCLWIGGERYVSLPVYSYCTDIIVGWQAKYVSWPVYSYCTDTVFGREAKYAGWLVYSYCIDTVFGWEAKYISWPVYSYCTETVFGWEAKVCKLACQLLFWHVQSLEENVCKIRSYCCFHVGCRAVLPGYWTRTVFWRKLILCKLTCLAIILFLWEAKVCEKRSHSCFMTVIMLACHIVQLTVSLRGDWGTQKALSLLLHFGGAVVVLWDLILTQFLVMLGMLFSIPTGFCRLLHVRYTDQLCWLASCCCLYCLELEWVTTALAMVGKLGISAAFTSIYLITAELFPTVMRNFCIGCCSTIGNAGGTVSPYIADLVRSVSLSSVAPVKKCCNFVSPYVTNWLEVFVSI